MGKITRREFEKYLANAIFVSIVDAPKDILWRVGTATKKKVEKAKREMKEFEDKLQK